MIPTYAAYNPYISSASKLFGVDPRLINGVIALETSGRSGLTSPTGAVGVMQVQPTTYDALAKRHGFGADAADDENNILAGTAYLSEQLKANNGDWAKALAAYNAGPGGSAKFRQTGDYSALPQETRQYLQRAAQMGLLDPNAAPPVEVAARKPAQPLTATSTQSATTANGVAAMPDTPAQPAMPPGLLSTDEDKSMLLLALGSGLLSGRNWAEGLAGAGQGALSAMSQAKRNAMQQQVLQRQLAQDKADQDWRKLQFQRLTQNDANDLELRRRSLDIQQQNATKQQKPDVIKAMEAAGIDPQSPEGQKYLRQRYLGGFGDDPATTTDRGALATSLGVPKADVDPYADPRLSPKGREQLMLANQRAAEKRWNDYREAEDAARQQMQKLKRFAELNDKVETGGKFALPGAQTIGSAFDSDVSELGSLTSQIAPTLRQPGSGSVSDFDAKQFLRGTVGLDKPREANKAIATAGIAASQQTLDRGEFERAYFDANGHIQGADRAWKQYLDANPIFDPNAKEGELRLNPNRKAWRDYFGQAKAEVAQGGGSGGDASKMSDDELLKSLGVK